MQNKLNLQTCFNQVKEFQEVFDGLVIPYNNATPSMIRFREGLFQEEATELIKAIEEDDFVELCDALADCIYVELGTLIKFGLTLSSSVGTNRLKNLEEKVLQYLTPEQFHSVFDEVHRSNISKICKTLDIAYKTMAQEQFKDVNFNVRYLENNKGIVLTFGIGHPKENKVIKPIDYSPADLRFVLDFKAN